MFGFARIWQGLAGFRRVSLKFRAYLDLDLEYGSLPARGIFMRFEATVLFLVLPYTSCCQFFGVGSQKSF